MKRVLLLGATGQLGQVVLVLLLQKKYSVTILVRSPEKIKIESPLLKIVKGNVVDANDLEIALAGVDIVISVLGHGFRTPYPIQSKTLESLIPLMEEQKIRRLVTITGAALRTHEDPPSIILDLTELILGIIDPYRMRDARLQQELFEKSDLEWTVIRTPVHKNGNSTSGNVGYLQPYPWQRVTRKAVANFMIECIEKNEWIRKSPIFF